MGIVKKRAVYVTDLCEECGICAEVCPIGAIWYKLPHFDYAPDHPAYRPLVR
jgi:ferredoxin